MRPFEQQKRDYLVLTDHAVKKDVVKAHIETVDEYETALEIADIVIGQLVALLCIAWGKLGYNTSFLKRDARINVSLGRNKRRSNATYGGPNDRLDEADTD